MGAESTFTPAPRRTAADEANDRTSTNRKLDEKLYLITKTAGGDSTWRMPQVVYGSEPSLRATAERCITEIVSPETQVYFVGNFPVLCSTVTFPSEQDGLIGTKTFFFRAALISMTADVNLPASAYSEYAWVSKDELAEYDEGYADTVTAFMP